MQMQRLFTEMEDSDRLLPLHVGLDASGGGSAFIARNFVSPALVAHAMLDNSPAGLPIVTASIVSSLRGSQVWPIATET